MPESLRLDFLEGDFFLDDEIYIDGIKEEIKETISHLGGVKKSSKLITCKRSRVKEWPLGRKPIPLNKLKELLGWCDTEFRARIKAKILKQDILMRTRYSGQPIILPKEITQNLAYAIGLILGDGYIAGRKANERGDWTIAVYFDNFEHLKIYSRKIHSVFGIVPKSDSSKGTYHECYFGSKAVHWFLRNFFSMETSPKDDKIVIPARLMNCRQKEILAACIRGLFDSDGTVIPTQKRLKYASTSRKIILQMASFFTENGFSPHVNQWLKSKKYKPLYTVTLNQNQDIIKFAQQIGLIHPKKKRKLDKIAEKISPVV